MLKADVHKEKKNGTEGKAVHVQAEGAILELTEDICLLIKTVREKIMEDTPGIPINILDLSISTLFLSPEEKSKAFAKMTAEILLDALSEAEEKEGGGE